MPKLVKKMSRDFTIINNKILRDTRLGSSERGLLVTMLSLPNGWSFSIRGLAQILPDGITKISNGLNKLESLNYLRRERRYKNGRISNWDYIISDEPMDDVDPSEPDQSDAGNSAETPPFFEKHEQYIDDLDTENLNQGSQNIEKPHDNKINNNQETNNQEFINKSLYQSIPAPAETAVENSKKTDRLTDDSQKAKKYLQEMQECVEFIKYQINYDDYIHPLYGHGPYIPVKELDEHIESIARTICNDRATITICGQEYPHEVVKSVLLKVNINCLERTVDKVKTIDDIRNLEKYFLSTLFNEINNQHFTSNNGERWADYAVKRDFGY
ncbi:MAG: DUF6017 domain-containing protein [Ruminococcus flavefaciens]|nr:DUF6017 domain-containing protein [Ruminococcus flavefaciens]